MKHTIIILLCFLCGHAYTLQAEDANAQQYQDSILKVAQAMPSTSDKLEYLRDIVYKHQYAPYNKPFSTALYREACAQRMCLMRIWEPITLPPVTINCMNRILWRTGWIN